MDYSTIISLYFNELNEIEVINLSIVNILRLLEIVLLMKPSQSSTERAISRLKNTVTGRYESIYNRKGI